MNNYLMLNNASLYQLRLDYFKQDVIKTSSIFYSQNKYYLIMKIDSVEKINHKLDKLQTQIFNWGVNQIEDTLDYIKLESQSRLAKNGRELLVDNVSIIRTFYGLSEIMAILNLTTDSFSDGNINYDIDKAISFITEAYNNKINLIDIGFESTRSNAIPKTGEDEILLLKQYLPQIIKLKSKYKDLRLSIDTYHAESIKYLKDQNIDYINDVSGNLDTKLINQLHANDIKYIAMHSLDIPVVKEHIISLDNDPVSYIKQWQQAKINYYQDRNVDLTKIIFDPGIGFGNNPSQAFAILRRYKQLQISSSQLLLGFSRKSLFSHLSSYTPIERDLYTATLASYIDGNVPYLRVHDYKILSDMLMVKNNI